MTPVVLAIDLGSTRFKAAVLDASLVIHGLGTGDLRHRYASGGIVEIVAEDVVGALTSAINGAVRGLAPSRLKGVAITSQAQTFTVVDCRGRVRMPFVSWQDSRAVSSSADLAREPGLSGFAEHTSFAELGPGLQICQLRHLRESRPGWIDPADRVMLLPAYVAWLLTGAVSVDVNLAAMSGLYSLEKGTWWPAALDAAGIMASQLPALAGLGEIAAITRGGASSFALPADLPLVLAGNDQTAGAYGADINPDGGLLITLGTAQVAYRIFQQIPSPRLGTIRGVYPGGRYYRMAADSVGGNLVGWAQSVLAQCGDYPSFMAQAETSPEGCHGLVFEADLLSASGTWHNMNLRHRSGDFARSILEALSKRMVMMVGVLDGLKAEQEGYVAGGGSEHALWRDILSRALGHELVKIHASPLDGAARMAWQAIERAM